jgi:hypothetical protein
MTTFLFVALAFAFGFTAGLAWRWYDGHADSEIIGDRLTPLRCAQLNATVIWCGIKGLTRAVALQLVTWYVKLRNRV